MSSVLTRSEIRHSTIRKLVQKVKDQKYGSYLHEIRLSKVRAFSGDKVSFDFPVTAVIGTNGGGKSTILGAAAIAYRAVRPSQFFPKSSIGDQSMSEWQIEYDIIDKRTKKDGTVHRTAKFRQSKWVRDDLIERDVLYFGIRRTVPAGEKSDYKKFASNSYEHTGKISALDKEVAKQIAKVLGKNVENFKRTDVGGEGGQEKDFYIGGDGNISYSEFHFGAGESSIIRMISKIEETPENSLILIEEIENGLHPVAVRRMVEYLIEVAERRSVQTIFTTQSQDALGPLPSEGIWASIDGHTRQGFMTIEALRAVTGRVDERIAVFVEDDFAKAWVEAIIRLTLRERVEEIGVYAVGSDTECANIHTSHTRNPAIKNKSCCIVDGNSQTTPEPSSGILKLPGGVPEATVFDYVVNNIDALAAKLTLALQLPIDNQQLVKSVTIDVSTTNRDPHLLFSQVGERLGFIPEAIVRGGFIGTWNAENSNEVNALAQQIQSALA